MYFEPSHIETKFDLFLFFLTEWKPESRLLGKPAHGGLPGQGESRGRGHDRSSG
jgi:hypothetical protein